MRDSDSIPNSEITSAYCVPKQCEPGSLSQFESSSLFPFWLESERDDEVSSQIYVVSPLHISRAISRREAEQCLMMSTIEKKQAQAQSSLV